MIDARTSAACAVVPLRVAGDGSLEVATSDPQNVIAIDDLRILAGREIRPVLALPKVAALLNKHSMEEFVAEMVESRGREPDDHAAVNDSRCGDAPVVRLVYPVSHAPSKPALPTSTWSLPDDMVLASASTACCARSPRSR